MKTILLIHHQAEVRERTAEILKLANYEVLTAEKGKSGVEMANRFLPDLILCHSKLPDLDGFGVLYLVNQQVKTRAIPFLVITSHDDPEARRRGMQLGADGFLEQPLNYTDLLDAIESRIKRQKQIWDQALSHKPTALRPAYSLEQLLSNREVRIYRPKDYLYKEQSYPHFFYVLKRGKVKTLKTHEDGKVCIVDLHKPGDQLGVTALMRDEYHRESAVALEESEVILVPREDFLTRVYESSHLLKVSIRTLTGNLIEKEDRLVQMAYSSVRQRVADALLLLLDRYRDPQASIFSMPIAREDLASIVGTSKGGVLRVLAEFKEDGIIDTEVSRIVILDEKKLRRVR